MVSINTKVSFDHIDEKEGPPIDGTIEIGKWVNKELEDKILVQIYSGDLCVAAYLSLEQWETMIKDLTAEKLL